VGFEAHDRGFRKGPAPFVGSARGGWPPQWELGGKVQGRTSDGLWFKSLRPLQKDVKYHALEVKDLRSMHFQVLFCASWMNYSSLRTR
jgi:hypothetical protein